MFFAFARIKRNSLKLAKVRPWLQSGETLIWRRTPPSAKFAPGFDAGMLTHHKRCLDCRNQGRLSVQGRRRRKACWSRRARVPGTTSMRRLVRAEYTNYMRIGSGGGCGTTSGSGSGPVGGTTSGSDPGSGSGSGLEPGCGLGKGGVIEAFAGSGMLLYLFLRSSIRNSIIDAGLGSSSIRRTDKGIYFGSD